MNRPTIQCIHCQVMLSLPQPNNNSTHIRCGRCNGIMIAEVPIVPIPIPPQYEAIPVAVPVHQDNDQDMINIRKRRLCKLFTFICILFVILAPILDKGLR